MRHRDDASQLASEASGTSFPRSVLAVCAHPDDESFGLGAVIGELIARGARTSVLCFTHGEASSLGSSTFSLHEDRHRELAAAAAELGVQQVTLRDHPDGALGSVPLKELVSAVEEAAETVRADLLLVFDEGGVTGHADHCRATEAALATRSDLPVLAWNVPRGVGEALNAEFGATFLGRDDEEFDVVMPVDRATQRRAIACHVSQSTDNPVLWRRLELLGDTESLRWLRRPAVAHGGMGALFPRSPPP